MIITTAIGQYAAAAKSSSPARLRYSVQLQISESA